MDPSPWSYTKFFGQRNIACSIATGHILWALANILLAIWITEHLRWAVEYVILSFKFPRQHGSGREAPSKMPPKRLGGLSSSHQGGFVMFHTHQTVRISFSRSRSPRVHARMFATLSFEHLSPIKSLGTARSSNFKSRPMNCNSVCPIYQRLQHLPLHYRNMPGSLDCYWMPREECCTLRERPHKRNSWEKRGTTSEEATEDNCQLRPYCSETCLLDIKTN